MKKKRKGKNKKKGRASHKKNKGPKLTLGNNQGQKRLFFFPRGESYCEKKDESGDKKFPAWGVRANLLPTCARVSLYPSSLVCCVVSRLSDI